MKLVSIATSGLMAATKRLDAAANNIVNSRTTGTPETVFRPSRTVTAPAPGGGVIANAAPVTPAFTSQFAPDDPSAAADGSVAAPNVFLAGEFVEMRLAETSYRASLKLLEVADELAQSLLDITDRDA